MTDRLYVIPYSRGARKRHYHKTNKDRVINFTVQLEVEVEGEWKPVVRYDCSHKEGDAKFNQWSRKLAKSHARNGQPIVYIHIRKLRPLRSRIERLELKRVA